MRVRIGKHWVYYNIKTNWSAATNNNKAALRSAAELSKKEFLKKKNKSVYVSISHTKTAGGFAICRGPVGFDIEPRKRKLSTRATQRLGNKEEHQICPSAISLWVMKEAAWKSLKGPHQPKTITKIKILSVRINKSNLRYLFTFNTTTINGLVVYGKGVVILSGRLILGIALI